MPQIILRSLEQTCYTNKGLASGTGSADVQSLTPVRTGMANANRATKSSPPPVPEAAYPGLVFKIGLGRLKKSFCPFTGELDCCVCALGVGQAPVDDECSCFVDPRLAQTCLFFRADHVITTNKGGTLQFLVGPCNVNVGELCHRGLD